MKRFALTSVFVLAGLFSTWACLVLLSHVDFEAIRPNAKSTNECGDYGQCEATLITHAKFLSLIFLPTVAHLAAGIVISKRNRPVIDHIKSLAALFVSTLLFYAISRLLSGS